MQKRQYIQVKCKDCKKEWSKRKDTISTWLGRCRFCAQALLETTPKRKEQHTKNGLAFIKKFGKLASPKMENRCRQETHYKWRGGITPFRVKIWKSEEYKNWRKSVFERDNYKCVICNKNTHALQADHIKPFAVFIEDRFSIENGRTLCIPCHRQYGARVLNGVVTREAITMVATG